MATRPTKTGGNTTYVAEVAAGQTIIRASEVDGDLNELYTNITNGNVATGAAIATAKLADDAGITTAKLGLLSVTTAKIADNAVTKGKLAIGATENVSASIALATLLLIQNAELDVAILPPIMTRGGRVRLEGGFGANVLTTDSSVHTITWRWYRGVTLLVSISNTFGSITTANTNVPVTCPPMYVHTPAAGTYTFKLTMQTDSVACSFKTGSTNPGFLYVTELS